MSDAQLKTWMEGSGQTTEKTNVLINRLITEMNAQGAYQISTKGLNTVIEKVLGVSSDDTQKKYRKNIVKHGPFTVGLDTYTLVENHRGGHE